MGAKRRASTRSSRFRTYGPSKMVEMGGKTMETNPLATANGGISTLFPYFIDLCYLRVYVVEYYLISYHLDT